MAEVRTDIAALRAFRVALERFRYEQRQVLAGVDREIDTTRASLDCKAQHRERELREREDALEQCRRAAERAAAEGWHVDCSAPAWAVAEARDRLHDVREWQTRVDQEVGAYQGERSRFDECVEIDTRRSTTELDKVIVALEAVRATRLTGGTS